MSNFKIKIPKILSQYSAFLTTILLFNYIIIFSFNMPFLRYNKHALIEIVSSKELNAIEYPGLSPLTKRKFYEINCEYTLSSDSTLPKSIYTFSYDSKGFNFQKGDKLLVIMRPVRSASIWDAFLTIYGKVGFYEFFIEEFEAEKLSENDIKKFIKKSSEFKISFYVFIILFAVELGFIIMFTFDYFFRKKYKVSGQIIDSRNSEPIASFAITLVPNRNFFPKPQVDTLTDKDGYFVLYAIYGEYYLKLNGHRGKYGKNTNEILIKNDDIILGKINYIDF